MNTKVINLAFEFLIFFLEIANVTNYSIKLLTCFNTSRKIRIFSFLLQHFTLLSLNSLLVNGFCTLARLFDFLLQQSFLYCQIFEFIFKLCYVFGNNLRSLQLIEQSGILFNQCLQPFIHIRAILVFYKQVTDKVCNGAKSIVHIFFR